MPRKLTGQIAIGRVIGPYIYQKIGNEMRHTRPVKREKTDIPRSAFKQDLLSSFGATLTVCEIYRNDAARRVLAVLNGQPDPGPKESSTAVSPPMAKEIEHEAIETPDLVQLAHDQIVEHIQTHFKGHALAKLVEAVLRASGWVTHVSPPGPDGGVDILAGRGPLGLDAPRLCVQVKSQNTPADVTIYRALQGTMQSYKADQGLLVCWGGFTRAVLAEARQGHFTVRLWDSNDLVEAIYRTYAQLPAEIQAELPLKRIWVLVTEAHEENE